MVYKPTSRTAHARTFGQASPLIAEHTVLRNTYFLLSLTLLFSACTAYLGMAMSLPFNPIINLLCMWGLLFAVQANANNGTGIILTFAFTGFMGYTLGPLLNMVTSQFVHGGEVVMVSAATTGLIFMALSTYVLTTRKDFSFMGGMLFAMLLAGIVLSLIAMLTQAPMLFLMYNALMILVFSGMILFHTSNIIHGGERNYILATISLYLALYNLFISLMQIMLAFSGNDRD